MKRYLITVIGSVQGVGFRPFLYRLAKKHQLVGHSYNTTHGVEIDIQGEEKGLVDFQEDLHRLKPERASITCLTVQELPLHHATSFEIKASKKSAETALALLPDTALCPDCYKEFSDPNNRRYQYPFIHCMTCGPRFSLFLRMPFDRKNTSMADFTMCGECQKEYDDPNNRRFYSQTNCCPQCGPKLNIPLEKVIESLRQGKIVAVKNTGGYLLLVDALNEDAVQRLRSVKQRPRKPFALLVPSLAYAHEIAQISPVEEKLLTSPAAPIVLLSKKRELAPSVSFQSPYHGLMLPHTALQHLLVQGPLIATSGNVAEKPLCITEEEAFSELSHVADVFLTHNRSILHRLDDSVVQVVDNRPMLIRRARGYIPYALSLPHTEEPILGTGGQHKNCFAIAKKTSLYVSQHMGDLDSCETCHAYDQEVKSWQELLALTPSHGVRDLHPDYYTSRYLAAHPVRQTAIQHHKAHVFSCMLDNQLSPPLLGISWDGTGCGEDQTIWGGESFLVTETGMTRFSSLYPFRLPGSEKAVKEGKRSALGLLYALFGDSVSSSDPLLLQALKRGIHSPVCSSMGRLFDGVSSLIDLCHINHFEGEAALALEAIACKATAKTARYTIPLIKETIYLLDWRPMVRQIIEDVRAGIPIPEIAFAFHMALVESVVVLAKTASLNHVVLTGGVMQNRLLLNHAISRLREAGFTPYWHQHLPPNDGGLAAGQVFGALQTDKNGGAHIIPHIDLPKG